MAASLQSLLMALDSKGETPRRPPTGLLVRTMELHALRRRKQTRTVSKKRRGLMQTPKKPLRRMERRVRVLQRLVPNAETMPLAGLFREAAGYIACLEIQVKVMQIMVRVLSGDSDE